jgi:hypothetical protein
MNRVESTIDFKDSHGWGIRSRQMSRSAVIYVKVGHTVGMRGHARCFRGFDVQTVLLPKGG